MGIHHVGQAGLELLTSGDPSAKASQNAGITGVNHLVWPLSLMMGIIRAYCSLDFPSSSSSLASAPQLAETTGIHHHAQLIFFVLILVEMRSCYDAQAGLKLLSSSSPPTLASQRKQLRLTLERGLGGPAPAQRGGGGGAPRRGLGSTIAGAATEGGPGDSAQGLFTTEEKTASKRREEKEETTDWGKALATQFPLPPWSQLTFFPALSNTGKLVTGSHSVTQAGVQEHDHSSLKPQTSGLKVAGTTGMCHHTLLIFNFCVEMGSLYVAPACLELLVKQSSHFGLLMYWIIIMSHRTQPTTGLF
ncbi:hypothetical protein AAY473_022144 [Plecturocebus cupreus]